MLDVSIRIGLLNLMATCARAEGVSFLYITHDIASARYVSDRVMVMYARPIVEAGPHRVGAQGTAAPLHSAAAVGGSGPARAALRRRGHAKAVAPEGGEPQARLPFRDRCPLAIDECHHGHAGRCGNWSPGTARACHVARADAATEAFR